MMMPNPVVDVTVKGNVRVRTHVTLAPTNAARSKSMQVFEFYM